MHRVSKPRGDAFFVWPDEPACAGCRHYRPLCEHYDVRPGAGRVCHYLLDTGRMRPCPFGADCTRYQPD